jgi:hypothetical protein
MRYPSVQAIPSPILRRHDIVHSLCRDFAIHLDRDLVLIWLESRRVVI